MFQYFLNGVSKKNYANFSGRTNRREFWLFFLNICFINLICMFILYVCEKYINQATPVNSPLSILNYSIGIALLIFNLYVLIPSLAISVRRLHDSNLSGWFLLFYIFPVIGTFLIIAFSLLPPTPRANSFGPGIDGSTKKIITIKTSAWKIAHLIMGASMMALGFGIPIADLNDFYGQKPITATVVQMKTKNRHMRFGTSQCKYPVVRYTVNDKQYECPYELACTFGSYYISQKVPVIYSKNDPSYAVIDDKFKNVVLPVSLGFVGLLMFFSHFFF